MWRPPQGGMLRRTGMYRNRKTPANEEAAAAVISRAGRTKQENFLYMDTASQAMVLFCGKMRFMPTDVLSGGIVIANNGTAVIVEKLKRELRCRKADKQQQRNTKAI